MTPRSLLLLLAIASQAAASQDSIRGFPEKDAAAERKWEEKAKALPDASRIGGYMKRMSAKPHLAGTPGSKAVAEYALGLMKEWGLDAHLEEFEALLPTPRARILELLSPKAFHAKLVEPPVAADPTSSDKDEVPTYNAYSGSGDVTASLIYVNYGMPGDYDYLAKNNLDVKGKIVIARYGGGWRGLKPRLAQEHGALGCLIYSDPKDDGYYRGDVFPKGAFRPSEGVQRGSVLDMPLYPGDPLSPGFAAEPGVRRLPLEEARTLMKIPVMPISYGDALPLLQELKGPVAPEDWRGALGITYHLGDGSGKVHFKVDMDNSSHPLYDVIATIPGAVFPNEWVLAGNHHDAWVHGAMDPLSGASALLETARTLAEMVKQGWRPKRTILIALWDGEEFGLIGSTEFAEKHALDLQRSLVAYVNSDSTGKGQLGIGGSHTLEAFVSELAHDVNDPVTGRPLNENLRTRPSHLGTRTEAEKSAAPSSDWHMEALGSGSDYTSFLQHLGIASLNIGFDDSTGSGGIYHSAYDSYYWYTHFSDTSFAYGKTLAEFNALALMRLSGAAVAPFQFTRFVSSLSRYSDEIEKLERDGKNFDLSAVRDQIKRLQKSASAFDESYRRGLPKAGSLTPQQLESINTRLFTTEREMLLPEGLPRREWYKHAIYAPGSLTGYDVKTLPGIREAVEAGNLDEARQQAAKLADLLRNLNQQIQESSRALDGL